MRAFLDTLMAVPDAWIEPGTKVIIDCWAAYRDLDVQGDTHHGISHCIGVVDQHTGAHQHHRVHVAYTTGRGTTFTILLITCLWRGAGQSRLTNSQGSFTSSPQWTGVPVHPPRNPALRDVLLVSDHLIRHLQPQVNAHACSSKSSMSKVISVCFLQPQNATDLPWARITCCTDRHICPPFYSSSVKERLLVRKQATRRFDVKDSVSQI
jgi:hypothetical protein